MKPKIYILEDDEEIGYMIRYLLEQEGCQASAFTTVGQIREAMARELPDLLVTDIWLPDGDGRKFCKELREQEATSGLKVLMMTAQYGIREVVFADDFILKPFDIEDFICRVRKLLAVLK